jgi:hypothetical protein
MIVHDTTTIKLFRLLLPFFLLLHKVTTMFLLLRLLLFLLLHEATIVRYVLSFV